MMNAQQAARRRELQRRAFAPGGGLTDAETAELRALTEESAVRGAPAADAGSAEMHAVDSPSQAPAPLPEDPTAEAERADSGRASSLPDSAASAADAENPAPAASGSHRRVGLAVIAAAATLLLGFGTGWLMFGRDSGPQMTAEQQKTFAEIESSNEYDPGSVRYLGSEQELSVWQATDDAGELRCIILTAGDQKEHTCTASTADISDWSLQASLSLTGPDGTQSAAFWATILEDADGNPVTAIQRHDMSEMVYDWRDNFTGTEREIAEIIDSQGYSGEMLQIVGYDGETPIWMHDAATPCMISADTERLLTAVCADYSADGLFEAQVDGVIYSVRQTPNRGPVLTITRTGSAPLDQNGEPLETFEHGDQIDDKTGDLE